MGLDQAVGREKPGQMKDIVGVNLKHLGNNLEAGGSFQR